MMFQSLKLSPLCLLSRHQDIPSNKITIMELNVLQFLCDGCFYCVCRDICLISESKNSFNDALERIKEMLSIYLSDKNYFRLQKMGWKVKGNSVIPINFAEDELVKYARDFLETEITNYQIIRIQLSQSRKMNKNLTQP